jgi:hypothetical protein
MIRRHMPPSSFGRVDPAWVLLRKNIVAWYSAGENFFAGELVKVHIERAWH